MRRRRRGRIRYETHTVCIARFLVVVHQYPLGGGGGGGGSGGSDGNGGHTTLFSAGHGTWARDLGRGIAIVIGRHVNGQHRWATAVTVITTRTIVAVRSSTRCCCGYLHPHHRRSSICCVRSDRTRVFRSPETEGGPRGSFACIIPIYLYKYEIDNILNGFHGVMMTMMDIITVTAAAVYSAGVSGEG